MPRRHSPKDESQSSPPRHIRFPTPASSPQLLDWSTLPREALARISSLAQEGLQPWEAQRTRLSFGRVCKSWRAIESSSLELVVQGSKKGKALSSVLAAQSVAQRERVKSLVLLMEGHVKPDGRGRTAAGLVVMCTKLKRLHLSLTDSLVTEKSKDAPFGKALLDAISARDTIKTLELHGMMEIRANVFSNMLIGLHNLKILIAPTLALTHTHGIAFAQSPRGLKTIEISAAHQPFLAAVFTSSAKRLTRIRLGRIAADLEQLIGNLTPLAPQLVILEAVSTSHKATSAFMPSFISKLKSIRTLIIGLEGFEYSRIFTQLGELNTVRELTISVDEDFSYLQATTCPSPDSARDLVTDVENLSFFSLPAELVYTWTEDDIEVLELDAEDNGVELAFT